jgi:hypothetical protein
MDLEIFPYKGVGDIVFGMEPEKARAKFVSEPKSFKRSPADQFPCDYFQAEGIFLYYDFGGHLEALEFCSPARPTLGGVELLKLTYGKAVSALGCLDDSVKISADGATAFGVGIGIYVPHAKDGEKASIESVIAFKLGYYD